MALKTCTRPAGSVQAYGKIEIQLSQDTIVTATSANYLASLIEVTAAADGSYSVQLQANNDLTPNNTYYTVTEYAGRTDSTYYVQVPQTAGPFVLTAIQVNIPPTPAPAGAAHVATLLDDGVATVGGLASLNGGIAVTGSVTLPAASIPESTVTNLTTDLAAKATDSLTVHLAGIETITGDKVNSGRVTFTARHDWLPAPVADNSTMLQNAINTFAAYGGGTLEAQDGVYPYGTLCTVSTKGITIKGHGGNFNGFTAAHTGSTTFKAIGANAILRYAPPAVGSADNFGFGGVEDIFFSGNGGVGTIGLEVLTWHFGKFARLGFDNFATAGLHHGVIPSWDQAGGAGQRSSQWNVFDQLSFGDVAVGSSKYLWIDGDYAVVTGQGDCAKNTYSNIWVFFTNQDAIHCAAMDNETFINLHLFRAPTYSGNALVCEGGVSPLVVARAATFINYTANAPTVLQGTEAFASPSYGFTFYSYDDDNATPLPTIGTGVKNVAWIDHSATMVGFKAQNLVVGDTLANAKLTPPVTAALTAFGAASNQVVVGQDVTHYFFLRWLSTGPQLVRGAGGVYVDIDTGLRVQGTSSGYTSATSQIYPANEDKTFQQTGSGLLRAATTPNNANGNNKDFAFSDVGDLYTKQGGAWNYPLITRWDLLKPSGAIAETFPRGSGAMMNQTQAMTSGTLYLNAVPLKAGDVISSITFWNSVTTSGLTHAWFALFDKNRNLLAWTGDDTSGTNWTSGTSRTYNIAKDNVGGTISNYTVATTDLYYIGAMFTTSTTNPSLANSQNAQIVGVMNLAPILVGTSSTGQTTTPPNPAAALTALATRWHGYVS